MTASQKSFRRLLQAARFGSSRHQLHPTTQKPLPCFPLKSHHVTTIDTPTDFHRRLCNSISNAKHRVHLASLYIGSGSAPEECDFLNALASVDSSVHVQILLDENRARRRVKPGDGAESITSSAEAVQQSLHSNQIDNASGLYLFPALPELKRSLLPSPLNEIAGVFHIKAYVIDDELILSGANLSQEYFTNRQDRYLQITNGGGGLVDFYSELIEILCRYSFRFQDDSHARVSKRQLMKSLENLMDGSKHHVDPTDTENVVAYAVPTFQVPRGFLSSTLNFPMDAKLTRDLLLAAHKQDDSTCVQLASAYLNPTPKLISTLSQFQHLKLLTAGYKSHGFAPRPGQGRRGDWVPSIFSALYAELEEALPHAEFLYYEREGWTFHAKGLWLTDSKQNGRLLAAVVGSGNYGARSEAMDIESNTILIFPHQETELQTQLMQEWTGMCQYAHQGHAIEFPQTSWKIKAALPLIRDLF